MGARPKAGNKYLLVVVNRTSKFLFAYPLPNKTADNIVKKLLELLLTFGIPLSLRSDPGTMFTAEVGVNMCCQSSGYIERHPIHTCWAKPPPSSYYSAVTAIHRWTLPHQAPTTSAWKDNITSLLTRAKPFAKCRTSGTTCTIAMCRDNSDESTRRWDQTHLYRSPSEIG